jgi:hypothetical protein
MLNCFATGEESPATFCRRAAAPIVTVLESTERRLNAPRKIDSIEGNIPISSDQGQGGCMHGLQAAYARLRTSHAPLAAPVSEQRA